MEVLLYSLLVIFPTPVVVFQMSGNPFLVCVYLGTVIWACVDARRLRFSEYDLNMVGSAPGAFVGCLLLWFVCFPFFLYNRAIVLRGKAGRTTPERRKAALRNGASLWIVYILFLLLTLVALPSLLGSRIRANENSAVSVLNRYHEAQKIFRERNYAAIPGNNTLALGYCDKFRNLRYGKDENGEPLNLLDAAVADASASVAPGASGQHMSSQGYLFLEDPFLSAHALWEKEFALVAYPLKAGATVSYVYWIGTKERIKRLHARDSEEIPGWLEPGDSPLAENPSVQWEDL